VGVGGRFGPVRFGLVGFELGLELGFELGCFGGRMIKIERDGHVAIVALDDPARRNAMTPELGDALANAVAELRNDPSVLAVVLAGSGAVFSGGGDLKMLENLRKVSREEARTFMLGFYRRYLSILDLEVPTVSAVHGAAIGAALCLAIACDLCIVEEDA